MHVKAIIVHGVEELMVHLILVSNLSIHPDRAPQTLSVLTPTIFHKPDDSTVAMQRSAVA